MKTRKYLGPLEGLNVIDFGHYYAGPMAGMLLADQGASVIRIVRPDDAEVSKQELPKQQWRVLNRNKKLLSLDLKTDEGKSQALSLIKRADVVIENFRPGVMKRLGLDYSNVKNSNPGLVYLSLPGFASTDKERAHIQAWEGVIGAASCMFTENHASRRLQKFPPLYHWMPLSSASGAIHGVVAIVAALIARTEDGVGAKLEVPLVDAGLSVFGDHFVMKRFLGPLRTDDKRDKLLYELDRLNLMFSAEDSQAVQMEKLAKGQSMTVYSVIFYPAGDGRKVLISESNPVYLQRLYKAIGIYDKLMQEGFTNISTTWSRYTFDNNLCGGLTSERAQRLQYLIAEAMLKKTADEWEPILEKTGAVFSFFNTVEKWLASDNALNSGLLCKMDNGRSVLTVPGRLVDVSGQNDTPIKDQPREPISINYDQIEECINADSFKKQDAINYIDRKKGDLLKGLKVLDLSGQVAGPTSTYTLAQYGAEVIKTEPPMGSDTPVHLKLALDVGQGKRSMVLDLKTVPGQEILGRLVSWADLVVHNILDDTVKRLGLTHRQLLSINPNVVSCQLTALGGTVRDRNCWESQRGYDGDAQVRSGIMIDFGSSDHPQFQGGISNDSLGGVSLALSGLLGIYQHRMTGISGVGRASLARASTFKQLIGAIAENGERCRAEASGQFEVGEHWWQRLYECSDAWIYIGTSKGDAHKLTETVLGDVLNESEMEIENALAHKLRGQDTAHWTHLLDSAGVACHRVLSIDDLYKQNPVRSVKNNDGSDEVAKGSTELLRWENHPSRLPITHLSPNWVRVGEEQSYKLLSPSPRRGAHTKEVLSELGYSGNEIEEFLRIKVAYEYLPALGNKEAYFFWQ